MDGSSKVAEEVAKHCDSLFTCPIRELGVGWATALIVILCCFVACLCICLEDCASGECCANSYAPETDANHNSERTDVGEVGILMQPV